MIVRPDCITEKLLRITQPSSNDYWHWAGNLRAVLELGYCDNCKLVPDGCIREGCGACAKEKNNHED